MRSFTLLVVLLLTAFALVTTAEAAPPTYLLLRKMETPGPYRVPGKPPAAMQPTRSYGYAYGWFGAAPRQHAARHFGYYRNYTEWSVR
jgi:hypothetical protein